MKKKSANKPRGIKYPVAVTSDGQLVSAIELDKERVKCDGMHFYSPGCERDDEEEMQFIARKHRKGVTKFFRHKPGYIKDKKEPDRYLHNYAELRLKQRFDESKETGKFFVKYYVEEGCPYYKECRVKDVINCQGNQYLTLKQLNLRELYDTCTIEKGEDKYIADLLLESSKNPIQPTLLEVLVTHKCSDEKKESGKRIIEIKIVKEEDAENEIIENAGELVDNYLFLEPENKPQVPPIKFYGFIRSDDFDKYTNLHKFTLTKKEDSLYADCKTIACNEINDHNPEDCAFSLSIPSNELKDIDIYEMGIAKALDLGLIVRDCTLCNKYIQTIRRGDQMLTYTCALINKKLTYTDIDGKIIKEEENPSICHIPYRCDGFDKSQQAVGCRKYSLDKQRFSKTVRLIEKKNHLLWVDESLLPTKPIEQKTITPVPELEQNVRLLTPQECFSCPIYRPRCGHCLGAKMKDGRRYVICDYQRPQ
ncbi:MAG: hypothetical protein IKX65_02190 [Prevotella sp.]|nr:hypothetical protein [Prevotella sp.]